MDLPPYIETAFETLKSHGAQGYAVGGCVRDALLGRPVSDYDLAVNVPPQETEACFAGYRVIETGLRHGTVTVVLDGHNVEITSFRTDGAYTDLRHPDGVRFTPDLREDLSRRDFTVNAMAYSPDTGLTDLFGGQTDLRARVLRCVGDPDRRFNEDALRILRALRFAAVLGFEIEDRTARSIRENAGNLSRVSAERIFAELKKLLCGEAAAAVLADYRDVIGVCLPPLKDLPDGTYRAAANTAGTLRDETLSFAALTCPLGPAAAEDLCRSLKTDNRFRTAVRFLTEHRDTTFSAPGRARRFFGEHGPEKCALLLRFQAAYGIDNAALREVCAAPHLLPADLRDLNVSGGDLAPLGFAGKDLGRVLDALLEKAAAGEVPNEREALLSAAKAIKANNQTSPV